MLGEIAMNANTRTKKGKNPYERIKPYSRSLTLSLFHVGLAVSTIFHIFDLLLPSSRRKDFGFIRQFVYTHDVLYAVVSHLPICLFSQFFF